MSFPGGIKASSSRHRPETTSRDELTIFHLNPTRADIFPRQLPGFLHAHRWACLYWLSKPAADTPTWYTAEKVLSRIPTGSHEEKRTRYIRPMEETARKEQVHAGGSDKNDAETLNITLERGWVYGSTDFREQMNRLIRASPKTSAGKQRDQEKAEYYLKQAQKTWNLSKKEILLKRKSSPEKVALRIILKERTRLSHRAIVELLNMRHPVSVTRRESRPNMNKTS